jgi:UPF0755 protein
VKRFFCITLLVMLLSGAGGTGAFHLAKIEYWEGFGSLTAPEEILIDQGTPSAQILVQLSDAGVIEHPLLFRFFATVQGDFTRYKAGEYRFDLYMSPRDVSHMLVEGKTIQRSLTFPEGWLSVQIVQAIKAEPLLSGDIAKLPPEGSLMPETYHFTRGQPRNEILAQMQSAMKETLANAWAKRAEGLPLSTPEHALILASIVEKETGVADERERVAAVFINRLRSNMPLQSDPTANYGLYLESGELKKRLLLRDVAHESDYNTYVIAGLPPTPICNPSRASIQATLHPADTKELYFVADGKGGHVFAKTLAEHNRNVAAYHRMMREQRATEKPQMKGAVTP